MKKILATLVALFIAVPAHSGLISHTDYVAGSVITAAAQNTNENAIVNEFNGNINSANIAASGVATTNIAANAVTYAKFDSVMQSSVTVFGQYANYRRPNLKWVSTSTVDIESGLDGTANDVVIFFPDGQRRVDSTTLHTRLDVSRVYLKAGVKQSGLQAGTVAANTWYEVYAVKATDNLTDFVAVADTVLPLQANFSNLNTAYGVNSWVPLGLIRYGDNSGATTAILVFVQHGNHTLFDNTATGQSNNGTGIRVASTAGATTLTYTYAAGTGTTQIPATIGIVDWAASINGGSTVSNVSNAANTWVYAGAIGTARYTTRLTADAASGMLLANGSSVAMDVFVSGFTDSSLGIGFNPNL